MDTGWATILAAIIPVFAAGFAWLIKEARTMRKENRTDHAGVLHQLKILTHITEKTSERLDGHIDWHLDKEKK
jgi:hypothetical protein